MLTTLLRGAAALSYAIMVFAGTAQVVTRFFLGVSLPWSEEVIRYTFVWSVFLTAALIMEQGAHIRVDYFAERYPPALHRAFGILGDVLTLVFVAVLGVAGGQLVLAVAATGSVSPAMEISMAVPYAAIPVGSALMVYYQARRMWRRWSSRGEHAP